MNNDQAGSSYLFLCPLEDLQPDMPGVFRGPACPAYWSLDPSGIDRLRPAEARALGFPHIDVQVELWGKYWNGSVYAGISRFHEVKQFDPSQEADYPNYHLDRDALSVHNGTYGVSANPGSLVMKETRYDTTISSESSHENAKGDSSGHNSVNFKLPASVQCLTGANSGKPGNDSGLLSLPTASNIPSGNVHEAQMDEPSRNLTVMYLQFMLIVVNSLFFLYY